MPLVADRVKETTTTTGTGTLTLAGATTGYQSFTAAFGNGVSVYYVIAGGADWEVGIGTTGAGTLTRDTVLASSNANALVPLAAGAKDVFCAYVAGRAVTTEDAATLTNKTIDSITNFIGANQLHVKVKATENLAKGDVCKVTGWNAGENAIEVAKVASASDTAFGMADQVINIGDLGTLVNTGFIEGLNTNAFAPGTILYPNTSGGVTSTKPSSGLYQAVAYVLRQQAVNGVLYVEFTNPQYVEASTNTANTVVLRDGSGNFSAGTITAALSGNATTATTATQVSNALTAGTYLTSGGTFTGAAARTFAVDATEASTASKVVARNASGQVAVKGLLVDGTSSGTVTVQGAAAAGTWALTLPTSGGTNGHVLTTDGAGTTSWAAASGSVTIAATGTNASFYPVFVNATTGSFSTMNVDSSGLTYNPSTNAMSIGSVSASNLSASSTISASGGINMGDTTLSQPQLSDYTETYTASGFISGGTLNISVASAHVWRVARNANITTLNITAGSPSNLAQSFTLIFDANGSSYTITWPAAVKWPGGTAPTITTTNGRSDMFVFYTNNAGTTWYAMTAAQNFVTT